MPNGGKKKKNGRNGGRARYNGNGGNRRSRADQVLAQGTAAVPRKAWGGRTRTSGATLACWDAKLPMHLPLPRAVGPYTTIRTTARFASNSKCVMIGTFKTAHLSLAANDGWTNQCAVTSYHPNLDIGDGTSHATGNAVIKTLPMEGLGDAVTLVPAALTVQIMNGQALQETAGLIYAGVMNTQAHIAGRAQTWDAFFDHFVEFQNPRILAAAKLGLRGVQINSYPLNMGDVSEFTPLHKEVLPSDSRYKYDNTHPSPAGWAPIAIYNTNAPDLSLEYLVTVEWRVRFDLNNPASASHTHKPVASDATWNKLMTQAAAFGNGVQDIADVVANAGQLYNRIGQRFAGRPLAIMG